MNFDLVFFFGAVSRKNGFLYGTGCTESSSTGDSPWERDSLPQILIIV
jgi:hypothetical protein